MRASRDWRCHQCNKLLGREAEGRLHIRFAGRCEYRVAAPASAICHGCGALNELAAPVAALRPEARAVR